MVENKKKYAYWMYPSMVKEIEKSLDMANATSKSDFVCQAVNFYIRYLHLGKSMNLLAHDFQSALQCLSVRQKRI